MCIRDSQQRAGLGVNLAAGARYPRLYLETRIGLIEDRDRISFADVRSVRLVDINVDA